MWHTWALNTHVCHSVSVCMQTSQCIASHWRKHRRQKFCKVSAFKAFSWHSYNTLTIQSSENSEESISSARFPDTLLLYTDFWEFLPFAVSSVSVPTFSHSPAPLTPTRCTYLERVCVCVCVCVCARVVCVCVCVCACVCMKIYNMCIYMNIYTHIQTADRAQTAYMVWSRKSVYRQCIVRRLL